MKFTQGPLLELVAPEIKILGCISTVPGGDRISRQAKSFGLNNLTTLGWPVDRGLWTVDCGLT